MRILDSLHLRICVPPEAESICSLNICGAGFGNCGHNIILRFFAEGGRQA
jgi:predicted transcriptional regulator